MGKLKATVTDTPPAGNPGDTPISGGEATSAPTPEQAVVVFGKDENGKAHASWFSAADAELAIKAAGLMRMRVLPIIDDAGRAAVAGLAQGRVFESGKGFVPFCKMATYEALTALPGAYEPPAPVEPESEAPVVITGVPGSWESITVGSAVLASAGGDDASWWPSIVTENKGEGLFVLRWENFDDELSFVRRADDLALMPPSAAAAFAADALTGEAGGAGA